MTHSPLLIDIGNTALKFCFEEDLSSMKYETLKHGEFNVTELLNRLNKNNEISLIALSTVYVDSVTNLIKQWCKDNHAELLQVKSEAKFKSLINGYQKPNDLGVDRWLSMIALNDEMSQPYTVISCGTAITLDCVDPQGVHMGGVIMPGIDLMVKSLVQDTMAINEVVNDTNSVSDDFVGLAKNTSNAVDVGILLAITGMIEKAISKVDMKKNKIFLTGGNSKVIKKNLNLDVEIRPGLVLNGLAVYLRRELSV